MAYPLKISQIFLKIKEKIIIPPYSIIAIYTAFKILNQMKKVLGIEAMLEYLDCSLDYVAKTNPALSHATEEALLIIDVEKIYQEILRDDKKPS